MEGIRAEDLSTIGGIATVSLLHSFIPTHWLPFSIVGRAQKWTLSRTLLVTAFGAVLHVISTSLLGITAITITNTIAGEETVHKLASLLLVILGGSYVLLFLSGKGSHSHSHNQPMEKMAVAGLVLVPALSPCATTLPVFLAVGNSSSMMVLAIIVLLFSTITVMTSLVALSFYGASQLKFHWVERYDKLLVDPSPLQDFCVAVNDSRIGVFVNGKFCKDPNLTTADDFIFTGLNIPRNTSNPVGSVATLVSVDVFPGINTLGVGFARIDFAPNGVNPPHTHPRASEILTVVEGTLFAGFVTSNPDNRLFTKVLYPGDAFVFPVGLSHFQLNLGNTSAVAFAAFSSQNPGRIDIANAVFGSTPPILDDVLTKAFQVDEDVIRDLQAQFRIDN
ncbi:hypothetical protein F0562_001777 [Nyssa sinensis]|uniref:Cupin type-1 domain-containing protein n=1 Tax=Nyssa sinensis TaxID=561372 RepID=A0A5J5C3Y4_9ASTE|nr:hypothetical protein F0562_001777 [Nyssa sinensis]